MQPRCGRYPWRLGLGGLNIALILVCNTRLIFRPSKALTLHSRLCTARSLLLVFRTLYSVLCTPSSVHGYLVHILYISVEYVVLYSSRIYFPAVQYRLRSKMSKTWGCTGSEAKIHEKETNQNPLTPLYSITAKRCVYTDARKLYPASGPMSEIRALSLAIY